ncbi:MAG: preprotein translocase subunit SecE [Chloroflexota bacterium]|nr:preprotein translocase subunit SecE [Chloroflexota bacterium]
MSRIPAYFREVVAELKKVVWPTRNETRRLTLMVIAISGSVGVILGAIDLGFTYLVSLLW